MEKVRKRLKSVDDSDRQMVTILGRVPADGLTAVEAACQEGVKGPIDIAWAIPKRAGAVYDCRDNSEMRQPHRGIECACEIEFDSLARGRRTLRARTNDADNLVQLRA